MIAVLGYLVFRASSSQRQIFNKGVSQDLLDSGWWGVCQHPNYLGRILMAVSASLQAGEKIDFIEFIYSLIVSICNHWGADS